MAFTYRGSASATATGATEVDCNRAAGVQVGDLLLLLVAFEGVASTSGPWIIPNTGQLASQYIGPAQGWQQVCWQAPSGSGVGLEVWAALHGSGSFNYAAFAANQNAVAVTVAYGGVYNPAGSYNGAQLRASATRQVTGNQPPAPSVAANAGDLVVACYADLMTGAGFGTPSGFTNRVDVARSGAGTVEAAIADATTAFAGNTGLIISPQPAASSSTLGSTATLAFVPAPTVAGVGPILDVPMPVGLDLADGWTLRITALDPVTGAVVPNVKVSNLAIAFEPGAGTNSVDLATDEWLLVPGSGA